MGSVRVSFLGCGDAFSAGGNYQSACLVQAPGAVFLLDCGAATLTAMKRFGLDAHRIDSIIISHLHGDHFLGIPFLLLEYKYEQRRRRRLRIFGPPGTERRVRTLFRAAYRELARQPLPFPVEFSELLPDVSTSAGKVRVHPFRVPHQQREISLGLSVRVGGRTIVYSGDTGWTEELITRSRDADLFICECCYFETRQPFHLDYPRLVENRSRLSAKRTILTHMGREVLARREQIDMELATDGLTVEI